MMKFPDYDNKTPRTRGSIDAWLILSEAFRNSSKGPARRILSRAIWHDRGNGCRMGGQRSSVPVRGVTL